MSAMHFLDPQNSFRDFLLSVFITGTAVQNLLFEFYIVFCTVGYLTFGALQKHVDSSKWGKLETIPLCDLFG